jgi:hypothetical protein
VGDAIRNITGSVGATFSGAAGGVFYNGVTHLPMQVSADGDMTYFALFEPGLIVPIANENRVRIISARKWRRVA